MKLFRNLHDKLAKIKGSTRAIIVISFMMFSSFIFTAYFTIQFSSLGNKYGKGIITLEEFIFLDDILFPIIIIYTIYNILALILIGFWIYCPIETVEETDQ